MHSKQKGLFWPNREIHRFGEASFEENQNSQNKRKFWANIMG